ncbi:MULTISPECIES: aspartate aminotransferase family protein [Lutimonas]|uniref:aspartate aminotransferase family protein n=1 Tax=Lutimonas TaxID=449810 RepID=UPI001CD2E639|nr:MULTISPECIES: aminotransferase class III-fold pyridoxal phosphate-dependent enzyme [Lutimonas]MCA0933645.1 aminotransferase class III-fold pyridoxal phosphate-dependent enzyme [Lutimonas saemankumensis]WKK65346.1 aminotransferase class III-fold pyridoxal phosphate-dependent enzyme [Lutimonas sp. YSD2104]
MNKTINSGRDYLSPVWTNLTEITPVKGEGIYLYDEAGQCYMDFTSGIGVTNTGHSHPYIVKEVQKQAESLLFAQMNCVINHRSSELAEKLNSLTPEHLNRFFFSNSGAEATESSVKLAKAATGRSNIIVFQGSFHGRTHLAMAMTTSKTIYRQKYHPLPSGIFVAPFPNAFYYGWDEDSTVDFCIKELDLLLKGQTSPDETAAIIIEPVLGEGGYVPAPKRFLQHLRKICDQYGIMLIIDEVQSGFGRTGKLFSFEHSEVKPDILVMAKGLGSGLPISAIASNETLMNKWIPGTHGGTYGGGSTLPTAAACATIDVLLNEHLIENASARGVQLVEGLKNLQEKFPFMGDIRGQGLMIGTEFINPDRSPNPEVASNIISHCLEQNLILMGCGTYKNVIRWIPPLVVTESEINKSLRIFEKALELV